MKKICIILSALLMANAAMAKSTLFRPYLVTIANHSGGIAKAKLDRNIRSTTGTNVIENGKSLIVKILDNNAKAHFHVGPEGEKSSYAVSFCAPTGAAKTLTLNARAAVATGFETQCSSFKVEVENNSGGLLTVVNSSDMSLRAGSKIRENGSTNATVHPGSSMIVKSGPESKKHLAKITFGVQTGKPTKLIFNRPGLLAGCATAKGVVLKAQHASQARQKFQRPDRRVVSHKEKMRRGMAVQQ